MPVLDGADMCFLLCSVSGISVLKRVAFASGALGPADAWQEQTGRASRPTGEYFESRFDSIKVNKAGVCDGVSLMPSKERR